MSDAEIRALERRVAEGDTDAEVPLVRGRLRAGLLTQARLDAATSLGDPVGCTLPRRAGGVDAWGGRSRWGVDEGALVGRRFIHLLPRRRAVTLACDWAERPTAVWEARYPELDRARAALMVAREYASSTGDERGTAQAERAFLDAERQRFDPLARRLLPGWEAARPAECAASAASRRDYGLREWWGGWVEQAANYAILIGVVAKDADERRAMRAAQNLDLIRALLEPA